MVYKTTPEAIDSLARFLDQHTFLPEEDCRALIRDAAAGLPITLPDAGDFAGEVLRAKLANIFRALVAEPAAPPDLKQNVPTHAAPPVASLPELTGDARAAAIRAMAGSDLAAVAEALVATSATMSDAHTVIMVARSQITASAPPKTADALKAIALAIPGVSGISGAMSGIGAAVAAISAPALFGIALAVAAVAGAGALLWKYWDRASAIFSGVARAIGDNLAPVVDAVKEKFQNLWGSVRDGVGKIAEYLGADAEGVKAAQAAFDKMFDFSAIRQKISEFFSWLGSFFQREVLSDEQKASLEASAYDVTNRIIKGFATGTQALLQLGSDMIQSLWDGMLAKVEELIAWVKTIPQKIVAAFGKIDLGNLVSFSPKSLNPLSWFGGGGPEVDGARAAGGPVKAGGTYLVGEEGPELFRSNRSGSIVPSNETMNTLRQPASPVSSSQAGSRGSVDRPSLVVNLGGITINGVQDVRGAADEIGRLVEDKVRHQLDGAFLDLGVRY